MSRPLWTAAVIVVLGAAVSGGRGRVQLALVHLGSRGMPLQNLIIIVTQVTNRVVSVYLKVTDTLVDRQKHFCHIINFGFRG